MKARIGQENAPILDTLLKIKNQGRVSFCTPGHKSRLVEDVFRELTGDSIVADMPQSYPDLDVLNRPTSVIKDAQELAAELFGADRTFFLLNGSTVGNLVQIISVLGPDDKVVVPKNSHKSVYSALALSGSTPIFVTPQILSDFNIPLNITLKQIKRVVANQDVKAILIQNPNYWGICPNLTEIAEYAHKNGILLLVDEAHGSHFVFSDKLPVSSCDTTTDIWVQSSHKTLSSFSQTSLLHVKGSRIDINRVEEVLGMLHTTSYSYLLLSSLDSSRRLYANHGKEIVASNIKNANFARDSINKIPGLKCLTSEIVETHGFSFDPTKLVVNCSELMGGNTFADKLRAYGIYCEMWDQNNAVFLINGGVQLSDISSLVESIKKVVKVN